MIDNNNNYNNVSNNNNNQKDELIKAYTGEIWQKIYGKRGNNAAFLFPVLYSFYRKLDYFAVINGLIKIILIIMSLLGFPFVSFINMFVVGAINTYLFNKLYVKDVSKKVDGIVLRNPNLQFEQLRQICANKGGVRSYLKIVMVIEFIITFGLGFMSVFLGNIESKNLKFTMHDVSSLNGVDTSTDFVNEFDFNKSKLNAMIDFSIDEDFYDRMHATESDMLAIAERIFGSQDGYTVSVKKIMYTIKRR